LLSLPVERIRALIDETEADPLPALDPSGYELLAPVQSQEVWAAGVTYLRSREARMEEATSKDIYAQVYEAERPELFLKATGWRVVSPGGSVGVRSDSSWDVPEPELAVLSNAQGEVVAYSCGNDMSSRSIEGENPLYLPQAKVYDASCAIGPAAVLAWYVDPADAEIRMEIEREGKEVFAGTAHISEMVRLPAELTGVLHASYTLPAGAWLLTGTSLVPDPPYTALPGDRIRIAIEGLGELRNDVTRISHSGARALPRIPR
jgi:2-dehydro-3-deoxy-D-arabinonate dehydratase